MAALGSVFPRRAGALLCALGGASLMAACVNEVPPQDADIPLNTQATSAPMPLPAGAEMEKPGAPVGPLATDSGTVTGSLRPDHRPPQESIPRIVERGYLIAGVDQSQNLMSFLDPATGELEGFEVDLVKEIARDIFGDPNRVDFRYLDSTENVRALNSGEVDIVVRTMSITPQRQKEIYFSAPYLSARTRMLTLENSGISRVSDLPGQTVCVADQSTALLRARLVAKRSSILKVRNWSDCLVAIQQHQADVIMSDDVILSGIAAQDPYLRMVGPTLTTEVYGIGIARAGNQEENRALVRQVNATLERTQADGTRFRLYSQWLGKYQDRFDPPEVSYVSEEPAAHGIS